MILKQKKSLWTGLIHSLVLLTLFSLASCTSISNRETVFRPTSGFGGTGYKPAGFGGTGNSSSGFGGTGIVGTVTKFGSIWVNGVEVGYGKNTQITSNLLAKDTLKLGQQVILETLPLANKTLTRKIQIYYPLAGEITQLGKDQVTVNHQYVVRTDKALFDKGLLLKKGSFIAINGFEDSAQSWIATRVNHNTQRKSFYQPIPKLRFSTSVTQVLIESTAQQLKQWRSININLKQLPHNRSHFMLRGKFKNNRIHLNTVKPYSSLPKKPFNGKKSQMQKMQGRRMFQQQKNMLKVHKQQKRMQSKG